jgi:L-alanine-DL-glutamate epimerase-like enolase superfamily enzyme
MKANELKITDIRVADIDGLPKHMILVKVFTNDPEIVGYGEVRDASSATYVKILKSRLIGENPLNIEKLFNRIKQFGGHSRQGGGVSGIEIALFDIVGKFYKVPVYQLLGGKYRDKVRIYCDTDVDGKHTGRDMGKALKKRMDDGFTFLKMDLGIELLYDEPGTLNAPLGMLEEMQKYSMKAICLANSLICGVKTHLHFLFLSISTPYFDKALSPSASITIFPK